MKSLFCLILLAILSGINPCAAARTVPQSVIPVDRSAHVVVNDFSPASRIAPSGLSGTIKPGLSDYRLPTALRKDEEARIPVLSKRHSLKERLIIKYLKKRFNKFATKDGEPVDPRRLKLGRLSLILGAGAFVVAFIPFVQILSPLMAIAAIALGIVSLKGNTNLPGVLGICFGGAFLLLILLAIAILVLAFASW